MGLLDSVIGVLSGAPGGGGSGNGDLLNVVVGMLADDGDAGGVSALLARFEQRGAGRLMESWIGSGRNLPISSEQLQNVLGTDTVANIAQQLGLRQRDTADRLSQMLPYVLDKLTPHGQVPAGGFGDIGDMLGQLARN